MGPWSRWWRICAALALGAWPGDRALAQDTAHVVVVATTDIHGRVTRWDYGSDREAPWGLSRAATAIDSLRRQYPGAVLLLDAGDLLQGDPFALYAAAVQRLDPNPIIDAFNVLAYDAATPGNHDFDFGVDVFGRAVDAATFAYVSGNIFRLPRDTFLLRNQVLIRRGGVIVGITGFTTPGVMVWERSRLAGRVRVGRILPAADRAMQGLAASRADVKVVLMHSGLGGPSNYDTTGVGPENVAAELATLAVKPDLVVVGHTHAQVRDTVLGGVHFVQPPPFALGVAVVHVWLVRNRRPAGGGPAWRVARIRGEQMALAGVAPDPGQVRRLQTIHEQVRSWGATPLANIDGSWSAQYARAEDTPIIDFVNEVQRRASGAQLSATAAFNTHAVFGPGAVRVRDVVTLYPYENTLKVVRIDGATLVRYLEKSAEYFRPYGEGGAPLDEAVPGYNYDVVSGVSYAIDLTRPAGSRIVQLSFRGRLVQPTDTFTLALSGYRQTGGGGFAMLSRLPVVYDQAQSIRDLLIEAARAAGTVRVADFFDDSWRIIPPEAYQRVRAAFDGAP